MENRLAALPSDTGGRHRPGWLALMALGAIVAITVGWWALALWPVPTDPRWLARTREVCFGTGPNGLPSAGGWVLLIGEPTGMVAVLLAAWGREVRAGLAGLARSVGGRLVLGAVGVSLVVGLLAAGLRVHSASAATAVFPAMEYGTVTPLDQPAPGVALVSQYGDTVTLEQFRGRPVLVTFAYAHCTSICPTQVRGMLSARRQAKAGDPVALIVTVDPWRDTPSRLPAIAEGWELAEGEYVLSGTVEAVQAVLDGWHIWTERDLQTGEVAHPATVYLIGRSGRIAAVGLGTGRDLAEAVSGL